MPKRQYGGRKKRPRTTAEKLLMAEFETKLRDVLKDKGWDRQKAGKSIAARSLGVSRASFYNYLNQQDMPSFEVLKRAHDLWSMDFKYIDFGAQSPGKRAPTEAEAPRQYVLSFIQAVRENDVEVIQAKPVRGDKLQLTVQIRFAG